MNFKMIKNILGWILVFEAAFMLIPLATSAICLESRTFLAFLISMGICLAFGGLMILGKPKNTTLYSRDGFVIVALSWILLSLFGAIPLYLSRDIPSYVDAVFETVSGFTTTGSSILTSVEALSRGSLIWRSFTNWIGGMGVLVFIMAFVPLSGGNNMHIMRAESPGPSVSKLVPRIKTTAMILYLIYIALTVLQFVLLLFGDMTVFEALCTSFSTAGTGGFGVKNDSLGGFSAYSQVITTVFMILFSINFASYYLILMRRFKEAFNNEVKCFLGVVITATAIVTLNIKGMFDSIWETLNHASFTVASIISTSGFTTTDFDKWNSISKTCLVALMFIGACAGSTGGGIKISRIVIMLKSVVKEFRLTIHPRQLKKVTVDKHPIENEVVRSTNVYMVCYVFVFAISVLVISFGGHDLVTSFTSVAATLNNVGPGLGLVGPNGNFAFFSPFEKLFLSFDMLAGRLELFPMLLLFTPSTWKK